LQQLSINSNLNSKYYKLLYNTLVFQYTTHKWAIQGLKKIEKTKISLLD